LRGYALTDDCLADLQVPSRMLLAEDDPVIPIVGLQRLARPAALHVDCAQFGGHCAFLKDYRLRSLADEYLLDSFVITRDSRSAAP
jgi:predicted alpha/beta-fold hydrolase